MKILQVGACPLTNQEVHSIVNEEFMSLEARSKLMSINKTESRDSHFDLERQRTSARNVLEYLKHGNPEFSHLDKAAMNAFLAKIADMPLTDAEVVQILNLMPSEADIFYGICRDNNRLTDDQIKAICALVNHYFLGGPPPPSAAPSEAPIASPLTSRQRDILALEEGAVAAVPMASPLPLEEAPPGQAAAENSVQQAPSVAPSEAPSGGAATESLSTAPPQSPSQAVLSSVAATGAPKEVVAGPPASHESQPATKKGRPAGRKKKAENSVQQAPSAAPSEAPSGNVANPAESVVQQAVSGDPAASSRLRKARRPKDAATAGSLSTAPPQAPSQAVLSSAAATGAPKEVVAELPASHESQQATESGRLAGRKKKRRVAQEDATTGN